MGGAAGVRPPAALVRRLYAHKLLPDHVDRQFAHDLARAYHRDTSHPGEVGAIDFDWRYGAQDFQITDLAIVRVPRPAGQPPKVDLARVNVSFRNFGKPGLVTYRLCRSPVRGWRIADVSEAGSGADAWDLRRMLKLRAAPVDC
jgi:hypothetical protein